MEEKFQVWVVCKSEGAVGCRSDGPARLCLKVVHSGYKADVSNSKARNGVFTEQKVTRTF